MVTRTVAARADLATEQTGQLLTRITGRALPYSTPTLIQAPPPFGEFTEEFAPGAFADSLRTASNLPLLVQHDPFAIVGVAAAWDDRPDGLYGDWRVDSGADAQESARLVEAGMLPFLSVRFMADDADPAQSRWSVRNGLRHVERLRARLVEVSLTVVPAYPTATVTEIRSAASQADAAARDVYRLALDLAHGDPDRGLLVAAAITGTQHERSLAAGLVRSAIETYGATEAIHQLHDWADAARRTGRSATAVNLERAAACIDRDHLAPPLRDFHIARWRDLLPATPTVDTLPRRRRRR